MIWLRESSPTGDIFCVGSIVPGDEMFLRTRLLLRKLVLCISTEIGVFWSKDVRPAEAHGCISCIILFDPFCCCTLAMVSAVFAVP